MAVGRGVLAVQAARVRGAWVTGAKVRVGQGCRKRKGRVRKWRLGHCARAT